MRQIIDSHVRILVQPETLKSDHIVGVGGGEYFIRGFFAAYNIKDGSLAWKFHTVPPAPGQEMEDSAQLKASKTWVGDWAKYGGGGSVWDGLVYDPETNLVFAGTGNPEPWPEEMRGIPKSDFGNTNRMLLTHGSEPTHRESGKWQRARAKQSRR